MPKNRQVKQSRRGAPDGNSNALKHGFYSRQFKSLEFSDLDAHTFNGLDDEIALFRVQIRRILKLADQAQSFAESMAYFRALSQAFGHFSRLVRAQQYIVITTPQRNEMEDLLHEAISEVLAEIRAEEDPLPTSGSVPASSGDTDKDQFADPLDQVFSSVP